MYDVYLNAERKLRFKRRGKRLRLVNRFLNISIWYFTPMRFLPRMTLYMYVFMYICSLLRCIKVDEEWRLLFWTDNFDMCFNNII